METSAFHALACHPFQLGLCRLGVIVLRAAPGVQCGRYSSLSQCFRLSAARISTTQVSASNGGRSDGSGGFPGDEFGLYPWDPSFYDSDNNAIEWVQDDIVTLFTTDGLIQIGGSRVPRQIFPIEKRHSRGKAPFRYRRYREEDYMDPKQGLCLGAIFDIAATNVILVKTCATVYILNTAGLYPNKWPQIAPNTPFSYLNHLKEDSCMCFAEGVCKFVVYRLKPVQGLDTGRRFCVFGFCRSIEMLSDAVEDTVLEQGGEVVVAEKGSASGLNEKLSMTVAMPFLWGVPPAVETLNYAIRSGGGIVEKVSWQWEFL